MLSEASVSTNDLWRSHWRLFVSLCVIPLVLVSRPCSTMAATAPTNSNGIGASNMSTNSATLNGFLTSTGDAPTEVWIYWGDNDGSTNKIAWDTNISMGVLSTGAFSTNISGLITNTAYFYRCYASNSAGDVWAPSTASFVTLGNGGIVQSAVGASSDDAEQFTNGTMDSLSSHDLEMTFNPKPGKGRQIVGVRFTDILVPQGATIQSAYIQFSARWDGSGTCSITVRVEAADNALTFATGASNISARPLAPSQTTWDPPSWIANESSTPERTPDLTTLVQETVNRSGWVSGNSMAFVITGSGVRTAWSYDGSNAAAAVLHIEWGQVSPAVPGVANSPGRIILGGNSALLAGELLSTGGAPADVTMFWGLNNGGTDKGSWSNSISFGAIPVGTFSAGIPELTPDTTYYYRCYASNSVGDAWADASTAFSTLSEGSLTNGLILYWKFDEGGGTTAADSSGSGNTGTVFGVDSDDWEPGVFGHVSTLKA